MAELLIVIVILGLLASVTVFAVRGITDEGGEAACAADVKTIVTAQEVHYALNGTYANEADLVSTSTIQSASDLVDTTGDANGYTVSAQAGSGCTGSVSGGTPAAAGGPPPASPPTVTMTNSDPLHGVPAFRYSLGALGNEADQIIVFGGAGGRAEWVAALDAGITTSRRTHFVSVASTTTATVDLLLDRADNSGVTTIVVFTDDDTSDISGGAAGQSVADYVQSQVGNYVDTTYRSAQWNGGQLAGLLAST